MALAKGLQYKSVELPDVGPHQETLYIHFAVLNKASTKTIVHITGVHGTEGYIGADIQNEIMKHHLHEFKCNVVFVHPLNPHGMAWFRRVNSHNVDLNRNGILPNEVRPSGEKFGRLKHLIKGRSYWELMGNLPQIYLLCLREGKDQIFRTVSQGQYEFSDSPFYGGKELQLELKILTEQLLGLLPDTEQWICLDVHTGLGPWAHESLLLDGEKTKGELDFFKQHFRDSDIFDPSTRSGYYLSHGLLGPYLKKTLPGQVFHITEEFGTYHYLKVFGKLMIECALFDQKKFDHQFAEEMLELFYPSSHAWKDRAIRTGVRRALELSP